MNWNGTMTQRPASDPENRVVDIRSNRKFQQTPANSPAPADNLEQFQHNKDEPDDFRHRMLTNALAFAFIALLIGGAVWLADSMLTIRKKQDCTLYGRRDCATIEAPAPTR
jgi:hypothetical protein